MPKILHALFGAYGLVAGDHLDESMALVAIDDTCLDSAKRREDLAEFILV